MLAVIYASGYFKPLGLPPILCYIYLVVDV